MFTSTNYRFLIAALFCIAFTSFLSAQDAIHLLNGEIILCKVTSLSGKFVEFETPEQQEGEIARIPKTEIDQVIKANGTTMFFNRLPNAPTPQETKPVVPTENKKPEPQKAITAQKLNKRKTEVLYPINYMVFGGVVFSRDAVSSFDKGYTLGLEYTNYYSNYLGFVGHISGTYNQLNHIDLEKKENVSGDLINSWVLVGAKAGTGTLISPVRIYGQAMIGGNYMLPMNGFEQVDNSFNLAYSGGAGIVVKDLIHLGIRYHQARQKTSTPSGTEVLGSTYMSLILGVQF